MRAVVILPVIRSYNEIPVLDNQGNPTGEVIQQLAGLSIDLPGLTDEQKALVSINNPSAMPPLEEEPDYAAVWIVAPSEIIAILEVQANLLFVIYLDDNNMWQSVDLAPQERVQIVQKLRSFGYEGVRFGLINAAIQASQNSVEAAVNILSKIYNLDDPFVYYLFDPDVVTE